MRPKPDVLTYICLIHRIYILKRRKNRNYHFSVDYSDIYSILKCENIHHLCSSDVPYVQTPSIVGMICSQGCCPGSIWKQQQTQFFPSTRVLQNKPLSFTSLQDIYFLTFFTFTKRMKQTKQSTQYHIFNAYLKLDSKCICIAKFSTMLYIQVLHFTHSPFIDYSPRQIYYVHIICSTLLYVKV